MVWYGYGQFNYLIETFYQYGVYSFLLPFMLIFAVVFGVLSKSKIFDNKGVNAIIALSAALLALQFDVVPRFFAELFPSLGVGISILLALMIFVGFFLVGLTDRGKDTWIYVGTGIGSIIFLIIIFDSLGKAFDWRYGLEQYGWIIILLVIVIALISIIVFSSDKSGEGKGESENK